MKDFTVLLAVYNAPLATELTLRSLFSVADHHIHKLLILDSSEESTIQTVTDEIGHKRVNFIRAPRRVLHQQAIYTLLQLPIQTPYIFITDSDVEYFDCKHFDKALEAFKNPQIAIAGEFIKKHPHPLSPIGNFFADRIGPWATFMRTNIAKSLREQFLQKPPQTINNEVIHYDMGMPIFEAVINSGYDYMHIPGDSYHHFVARSRVEEILPELDQLNIPRENAYKPDEEIKEKLNQIRGKS